MSEEREYRVISPLSTPKGIFKAGTVSLPVDLANELLSLAEPPIAESESSTPQENGQEASSKKSNATDGAGTGITEAQIVAAIATLEPGNEKHWTKGGLPDTNALADRLNHKISAAERDAAWATFQASQGGKG